MLILLLFIKLTGVFIVRYIRITGVYNTVNKVFHIIHFECSYVNSPVELGEDRVIGEEKSLFLNFEHKSTWPCGTGSY